MSSFQEKRKQKIVVAASPGAVVGKAQHTAVGFKRVVEGERGVPDVIRREEDVEVTNIGAVRGLLEPDVEGGHILGRGVDHADGGHLVSAHGVEGADGGIAQAIVGDFHCVGGRHGHCRQECGHGGRGLCSGKMGVHDIPLS